MKKFNEFLAEKAGKGLTIFDIDDTLFVSKARVIVVNTNTGKTKALTPMEFNSYKLRKHEEYDYGEFKSAKLFYQTATPIGRTVETAKAIIRNATAKGSKVIIIEDVITTGKSSLECVKLITKAGAKLVGFASIIDRSTKKTLKIKRNIISQMKINVPTFKKNKLPETLKNTPITVPGSRFIK